MESTGKRPKWLELLAIAAAIAVLVAVSAVGFAWSGVYSVSAAGGHWPVTRWFLHFAMRRSVRFHSLAVPPPPPLSDKAAMVAVGLRHYDHACVPCHGGPGRMAWATVREELPEAPYLPDLIGDWSTQELFWIVKNGIKYTGMPGWPAQTRDDEVWEMTEALLRLPALSQTDYARIVGTNNAEPASEIAGRGLTDRLTACARCHGASGAGGGAFPRLAGQKAAYLATSLRAYRAGARPSGFMGAVATELSNDEIDGVAKYFAGVTPPPAAARPASDAGGVIAARGIARRGIPACSACHDRQPGFADYPDLVGQSAFYLRQQLHLWRDGTRGGGPLAELMTSIASRLNDSEIDALADYYAGSKP